MYKFLVRIKVESLKKKSVENRQNNYITHLSRSYLCLSKRNEVVIKGEHGRDAKNNYDNKKKYLHEKEKKKEQLSH